MLVKFLSIENSVDHVTAKQSNFNLISQMRFDFLIFVDTLENVRCCGTIRKFKLIELLFNYGWCKPFFEVFNWHVCENSLQLIIRIFVE